MQYRQGDVLLVKIEDEKEIERLDGTREATNPAPEPILAYGEVTGHHHILTGGELYLDEIDSNFQFVVVDEPATLDHLDEGGQKTGEHESINIAPGMYFVVQQREYDGQQERRVVD